MKTVYINRATWGKKMLFSPSTGKMCCLGFVCRAYGLKQKDMSTVGLPDALTDDLQEELPSWLQSFTSSDDEHAFDVVRDIAHINDSNMLRSTKEKLLKPIFAEYGIRLVFRGK